MKFIKKYYPEIIIIVVLFAGIMVCVSPGMTFMNTDSDGSDYLLAAKYMTTAHNTSAPLYLLLGRLFLYIPFGSEAWRLGLISAIGTLIAMIFIYLSVRKQTESNSKSRIYSLVATVIYGGSALVISQSTIIETYALVTGLLVGAYYFTLVKRWYWSSVMLGLSLAMHPLLTPMVWIVLLFKYREMRHWKPILITVSFMAFYSYVIIVGMFNAEDNMWGNTSIHSFIVGNIGTMMMLTGGLSIWDVPKRILDTFSILGVSLGLGLILVVWFIIKNYKRDTITKKRLRDPLVWLFLIQFVYFVSNLAQETYVYLIVAIAFGSIMAGVMLSKVKPIILYSTALVAIVLFSINVWYFDLGRTLDPEMSAEKFYHEELPKIADGEIFMGSGWTWAMCYLYNKQENRNIIPISKDTLPADGYLDILRERGIVFDDNHSDQYYIRQGYIARSIVENNDGVWIAYPTKPEYYQYAIVPAIDHMDWVTRFMDREVNPTWQFKPSNPYKYISGQLEVGEWVFITYSNRNVMFYAGLAAIGLILNWLIFILPRKRKQANEDAEDNEVYNAE